MIDDMPNVGGRREPFGAGITAGDKLVISLGSLSEEDARRAAQRIEGGASWGNTDRNIRDWLEQHMPAAQACPREEAARDQLCCGACLSDFHHLCLGGRWREREDFEWYVEEIWKLWSQVQRMVLADNAGLAAQYGVELGGLCTEVNLKFAFEADALLGAKIRAGGEGNRKHPRQARVDAFDRHRASGARKGEAMWRAADELGVSFKTVEKDVRERNFP